MRKMKLNVECPEARILARDNMITKTDTFETVCYKFHAMKAGLAIVMMSKGWFFYSPLYYYHSHFAHKYRMILIRQHKVNQ